MYTVRSWTTPSPAPPAAAATRRTCCERRTPAPGRAAEAARPAASVAMARQNKEVEREERATVPAGEVAGGLRGGWCV